MEKVIYLSSFFVLYTENFLCSREALSSLSSQSFLVNGEAQEEEGDIPVQNKSTFCRGVVCTIMYVNKTKKSSLHYAHLQSP